MQGHGLVTTKMAPHSHADCYRNTRCRSWLLAEEKTVEEWPEGLINSRLKMWPKYDSLTHWKCVFVRHSLQYSECLPRGNLSLSNCFRDQDRQLKAWKSHDEFKSLECSIYGSKRSLGRILLKSSPTNQVEFQQGRLCKWSFWVNLETSYSYMLGYQEKEKPVRERKIYSCLLQVFPWVHPVIVQLFL